jgi:hypothetical protein
VNVVTISFTVERASKHIYPEGDGWASTQCSKTRSWGYSVVEKSLYAGRLVLDARSYITLVTVCLGRRVLAGWFVYSLSSAFATFNKAVTNSTL